MTRHRTARMAAVMIRKQLESLDLLFARYISHGDLTSFYRMYYEWEKQTESMIFTQVNRDKAEAFRRSGCTWKRDLPWETNLQSRKAVQRDFLDSLMHDLIDRPELVLGVTSRTSLLDDIAPEPLEKDIPAPSTQAQRSAPGGAVFVIHGHDETNLLRLEKLLTERWQLQPIVLRDKPSTGRTLIEKLEEEAQRTCFAFALLTPDDVVEAEYPAMRYCQARPNVLFELGWLFRHLQRSRVCVLCKKGTRMPSDLHGIARIEFGDSVEEKVIEIELELEKAGLFVR